MLLLKSGSVFWADIPKEASKQFTGQRPVVVLENIGEHDIRVIPLSTNTTNTNNRIILNLLLSDKVSYVSLLCDHVMTINKSRLKTQIGEVSSDTMSKVRQIIATSLSDIKPENIVAESAENDITIFNGKEKDIKDYIIRSNNILERMASKKTLVLNIVIAITTGIIASLITNVIWMCVTNALT